MQHGSGDLHWYPVERLRLLRVAQMHLRRANDGRLLQQLLRWLLRHDAHGELGWLHDRE